MQIDELLEPADVLSDVHVDDKPALLRTVAELLSASSGIDAATIAGFLSAREELGSTGIGRGIALPHARVAQATRPCAAFVRLAAPLEFASVDERPVDLVCAVIAPSEPQALALTALSTFSRILRDDRAVERLRRADGSRSLYDELIDAGTPAP